MAIPDPQHGRGLIVIGATESDAHVVSIYLLTLVLEEHGYEVVNLSCCNPTADFFAAIPPGREALALVIANQNGCALADLQALPELLRIRPVPVVVGGHYHVGCGSTDDVDRRLYELGVSCIAQSPEALLGYLQGLQRHLMPIDAPTSAPASVPQTVSGLLPADA